MSTLNKYKPTGSEEVDRILKAAHESIDESYIIRNKIKKEVNKNKNKRSVINSLIQYVFK